MNLFSELGIEFWHWWILACLMLVLEMLLPGIIFLWLSVAAAAAGRLKGGAAKVLVMSPALFGSISGSANVASTGSITLPSMTKLGYPAPCRRGRGRSLLRQADHATPDGCRCLCRGRAYRRSLHWHYARRSPAGAAVFRGSLGGHQRLCPARTG